GLTMAGISSKALSFGEPENKNEKFQGQPLDDDLGLNWYGFKYRNHDPQIGRFIQIDPLANDYVYNSPYAFSENQVTRHIELEGLEKLDSNDPRVRAMMSSGTQKQMESFNKNAPQAVEVTLSIGPGLGFSAQIPGGKLKAGIGGPQVSVTTNLGGETTAEGNLASMGVKAEVGVVGWKAGMIAVDAQVKDGNLVINPFNGGADFSFSASKKIEDKGSKTSGEATVSGMDPAVSVGAHIMAVGVEVKANLVAAGNAVANFFGAIGEYGKALAQDATKLFGGKSPEGPK
ncbi:hypothetical protein LZZ85_28085, partial [Terrimonas sp. NA20]